MTNFIDREVVDRVYEKGLLVDTCGWSGSKGFTPTHIQIRTVKEKELTLDQWERIRTAIYGLLDIEL